MESNLDRVGLQFESHAIYGLQSALHENSEIPRDHEEMLSSLPERQSPEQSVPISPQCRSHCGVAVNCQQWVLRVPLVSSLSAMGSDNPQPCIKTSYNMLPNKVFESLTEFGFAHLCTHALRLTSYVLPTVEQVECTSAQAIGAKGVTQVQCLYLGFTLRVLSFL